MPPLEFIWVILLVVLVKIAAACEIFQTQANSDRADDILFLEGTRQAQACLRRQSHLYAGGTIEDGSHQELLDHHGEYAEGATSTAIS